MSWVQPSRSEMNLAKRNLALAWGFSGAAVEPPYSPVPKPVSVISSSVTTTKSRDPWAPWNTEMGLKPNRTPSNRHTGRDLSLGSVVLDYMRIDRISRVDKEHKCAMVAGIHMPRSCRFSSTFHESGLEKGFDNSSHRGRALCRGA